MKRQHETASTTQAIKKQKLDEAGEAALKHAPQKNDKAVNADHKSSVEDEPTSDKETNVTNDPMNVDTEGKEAATQVLRVWQEHKDTRELYKNVVSEKDLKQKQVLFNNLVKEISSHELAEESVIQPAFKNLTKDEEIIKMAREQESNFKQQLDVLEKEYGTKMDETINPKLEKAESDLLQHMEFEETKILPILEKGLQKTELDGLNSWFDKVKKNVPEPKDAPEPAKALEALTEQPKLAPLQEAVDKIEPNKESIQEAKDEKKELAQEKK
jgi:hemerythrin superfamily protein